MQKVASIEKVENGIMYFFSIYRLTDRHEEVVKCGGDLTGGQVVGRVLGLQNGQHVGPNQRL